MKKLFPFLCATLLCSTPAFATTTTFNAIGNASGNGESQNASATFVTNTNSITVTLSNNLANPNDAGSVIQQDSVYACALRFDGIP